MNKKNILKIKNSKKYIYSPEVIPGGDNKDFFHGDDAAFARHKTKLILKTSLISQQIQERKNKKFATIKVSLKEDAIAKSHRPTSAVFNYKYPVIGGGDIGEIYVQVNEKSLPSLVERISQAKVQSEIKFNKNGEIVPKVGKLRSEVSAIENIELYTGNDKSIMSDIEFAQELLKNKREIIVELFTARKNETLSDGEISLIYKNLVDELKSRFPTIEFVTESRFFSDNIITLFPKNNSNTDVIELLRELKINPIVRKYYLSPIFTVAKKNIDIEKKLTTFSKKLANQSYPKVILIDKGIRSSILSTWVNDKSDALGSEIIEDYHADEMASILIGSKHLNSNYDYLEEDGCEIYDIWLPADKYSFEDHFETLAEFTDWLYLEVQAARENGFRVISMSINFQQIVSNSEYSFLAARIDEISNKLNVIFVISVGNLEDKKYRSEWPKTEEQVFRMLARFQQQDKVLQPADSVTSLSVGSVNHIENELITFQAPTRYTRRGPATAYGIKPDLVHIGGIGDPNNSCYVTLDGNNHLCLNSHGTSLAAPHIAKSIATIDFKSNESLNTNTLKALLIHSAKIPDCLSSKNLGKEAKDFVGFGFPSDSSNIINRDEASFTFIFEDIIKKGQVAEFNFIWPESLITATRKCKGKVKMSLVYTPTIDRQYGQEYIRVNIDASLQQEKIKKTESNFSKAVNSIWDNRLGSDLNFEKNLIDHGFKWWPSKVYERYSKNGFGNSSNWRLRVTSQVRDGVSHPLDGIPFSVIITIEDPTKKATKIYNEMSQSLIALGVVFQDITIRDEVRV
ncbi:S8 family serine peptidase [Citrobacter braakii]|uniref:S8 family serine peptidase n=1 Tax=Citrobacter braakii TaxID=57706 RepID=UPI00193CC1B7|nr:S8 family serine peptidase [Citrobacter braakii]MBM3064351.1 S8 family serine peptidase [Citrobacter braakii]